MQSVGETHNEKKKKSMKLRQIAVEREREKYDNETK